MRPCATVKRGQMEAGWKTETVPRDGCWDVSWSDAENVKTELSRFLHSDFQDQP